MYPPPPKKKIKIKIMPVKAQFCFLFNPSAKCYYINYLVSNTGLMGFKGLLMLAVLMLSAVVVAALVIAIIVVSYCLNCGKIGTETL